MVHYGLDLSDASNPACSRCGSRKTEVVGRLDDGRTLIVRCNTCGAHSTLITPESSSAKRPGAASERVAS